MTEDEIYETAMAEPAVAEAYNATKEAQMAFREAKKSGLVGNEELRALADVYYEKRDLWNKEYFAVTKRLRELYVYPEQRGE